MNYFIFILTSIILPIFLQIATGYGVKKAINFNINGLVKVQFYIVIPSLLFAKMYDTKLDGATFLNICLYSVILFGILYLASFAVCRLFKYSKPVAGSFINSVCFYNSGNYCLPLLQLLYNNPFAISLQILIMMVQNIATNTIGIFNSSAGNKSAKQALLEMLKLPMLYSVILALVFRGMHIGVWKPVWNALDSLGSALVPLALVTLGAQLAETKFSFRMPRVYFSSFLRLVASPIIAYLLVLLLGLKGIAAEVAVISAAAPTAVNSVLLAIQYDSEPDFASQAVFLSTVMSSFTVTVVIFLVTGKL